MTTLFQTQLVTRMASLFHELMATLLKASMTASTSRRRTTSGTTQNNVPISLGDSSLNRLYNDRSPLHTRSSNNSGLECRGNPIDEQESGSSVESLGNSSQTTATRRYTIPTFASFFRLSATLYTLICVSISTTMDQEQGFVYACRVDAALLLTISKILLSETDIHKKDLNVLIELVLPRILPNIPEDLVPVGVTRIAPGTFEYTLRDRSSPHIQSMPAFSVKWPPQLCEYFER